MYMQILQPKMDVSYLPAGGPYGEKLPEVVGRGQYFQDRGKHKDLLSPGSEQLEFLLRSLILSLFPFRFEIPGPGYN